MADIREDQHHGATGDQAQAWEPNPRHGGSLRRDGLVLMIGALIVAVIITAGMLISASGPTP